MANTGTTTEEQRRERHNAEVLRRIAEANREKTFVPAALGRGRAIHAAITTTRGHSGFIFARTVCQTATPLEYATLISDEHEVTCKRCLAGLDKRGLI